MAVSLRVQGVFDAYFVECGSKDRRSLSLNDMESKATGRARDLFSGALATASFTTVNAYLGPPYSVVVLKTETSSSLQSPSVLTTTEKLMVGYM